MDLNQRRLSSAVLLTVPLLLMSYMVQVARFELSSRSLIRGVHSPIMLHLHFLERGCGGINWLPPSQRINWCRGADLNHRHEDFGHEN